MAAPTAVFQLNATITTNLVSQRTLNTISNTSYRKTMETHKRERLQEHFEDDEQTRPGGAYGYEKRQEKYQQFKLRTKGHATPLVLSGRMKDRATKFSEVRATATKATLTIRVGHPIHAKQREEVSAITGQEREQMAKQYRNSVVAGIKDPRNQKKNISKTKFASIGG